MSNADKEKQTTTNYRKISRFFFGLTHFFGFRHVTPWVFLGCLPRLNALLGPRKKVPTKAVWEVWGRFVGMFCWENGWVIGLFRVPTKLGGGNSNIHARSYQHGCSSQKMVSNISYCHPENWGR